MRLPGLAFVAQQAQHDRSVLMCAACGVCARVQAKAAAHGPGQDALRQLVQGRVRQLLREREAQMQQQARAREAQLQVRGRRGRTGLGRGHGFCWRAAVRVAWGWRTGRARLRGSRVRFGR